MGWKKKQLNQSYAELLRLQLIIALDKAFIFHPNSTDIFFSYFSTKIYELGY